jgi:hypothetical protein
MSSFNGTENIVQNFCITFRHCCGTPSRIENSFVIKAAEVTKDKAKKIARILFPKYTDIEIISIDNDKNTLTPSEYEFLRAKVSDMIQSSLRGQEHRIKEGLQKDPLIMSEFDKYLLNLFNKMTARMDQFPVYHT